MATDNNPPTRTQPIAIIGMACRFPGDATSPSKLWDLCASGRDAWSVIPQDRFDLNSLYDANAEKVGRSHVRGGYFMTEDVTRFDAGFFNLPADVASAMDPQIRLLLEIVHEATEDAGLPIGKLAGSNTSVFMGCYGRDYQEIQTRDPESLTAPFITSNCATMFANRISHFYDLRGQSMSIDTACSSGLVALHQGCQSIWSGESAISIVGASSLMLSQDLFISMSTLGLLSAEGRCYAWDTRAHGYGRGEGVAALILKPLDIAIKEGDRIHAVVRDVGVNQDGKTTTITSPSMVAQIELIDACYKRAGLDLSETGYVEAHMTGTQTGDVVEAEALAKTFGKCHNTDPLLVGSVKTNIGHTEPVSGIAAVIKTAFVLKHRQIAPNQNYQVGNPNINLEHWHLQVPTRVSQWPQGKAIRASINNFGVGGTNAHVILERAPSLLPSVNGVNGRMFPEDTAHSSNDNRIYILSASDSVAGQEMAKNLALYLRQSIQEHREPSPNDLAYTLFERRSRLPWAFAVRVRNVRELAERLEQPIIKTVYSKKQPRLGFVFNGQGAQWYAMGRELIFAYPVFSASIHRASRILKEYGASWCLHGTWLLNLSYELMRDESSSRVAEINISQPISVALQLCLVELLRSWGIHPSAITSHSSGEIAAAYAINALSFKEALGIVYFRGELALKYHRLSSVVGGMLAAGIGAEQAEQYIAGTLNGRVVVACMNSPESITLSGDLPALEEIAGRLEKDQIFARRLKVPLAYHSHHMLPMANEYVDKLRSIVPECIEWNENIIFASPVIGGTISSDVLTAEHWARNLTSPVRFCEAFESMCAHVDVVVEIGAHSTLAGPIRQMLNGRKVAYASCLKRSTDAVETMQDLASELLTRGYPVDLKAVNFPLGEATPMFTPDLPTYPWNHGTRYWLEPRINKDTRYKQFPPHELLGLTISGGTGLIPTWRNFLRVSDLPWLIDHQVDSNIVLPGAAYISMAIEAVRLLTNSSSSLVQGYWLRDVSIMNALTIPQTLDGVEVHTRLSACNECELEHRGWYEFEINSVNSAGSWIKNCQGLVSAEMDNINKSTLFRERERPHEDFFFAAGTRVRDIDVASLYATMRQMNICHGPAFQNLVNSRTVSGRAVSDISIPVAASETLDYVIHPTTLDTIVQATFSGLPKELSQGYMLLPKSIGRMFVPCDLKRQAGSRLKAFTELRESTRHGFTSNIAVSSVETNESSCSFLRMDDFRCQAIKMDLNAASGDRESPLCFKSRWELDILHRVPSAVKDSMRIFLTETEADFERKLQRSSYNFIFDAVTELQDEQKESWAWHHKALYSWMEHIVRLGCRGALIPGSELWSRTSQGMKQLLNDELDARDACGRLTVRVGRQLASIIRGEHAPLEIMMEDNLLNQYYMEMPRLKSRTYKHLARVVELYAAKNPGAKVLEIGAGTGGATQTVLEAFGSRSDDSRSLLGHYTFTDVSVGFFPTARQKLAVWKGLVEFAELDIESDPAGQSFTDGSYDLIVASMVLHATKCLHKTMSHVRKLLKPGGKLLLIETTQDQLDTQLIFGTLPGWWLSEDPFRKHSPNVSLEVWDNILKATGFSGIDFDISDCEDPKFRNSSVILTTAATTTQLMPLSISVVYVTAPPQKWLMQFTKAIRDRTGKLPTVEGLHQMTSVQDNVYIFIAEVVTPILEGIDRTSFESLRNLLVNCRGVLWLSCGGMIDAAAPAFAQTQGLLRTLRQEHSNSRFVQLDFEQTAELWSEDKISFILHVLEQSFDNEKASADIEWEYAVKDSMLHVPRVYPHKHEGDSANDPAPKLQPFHQPGRILVWEPPASGLLSNLYFVDRVDCSSCEIPSGMVRIESKAFGLNFRDVMIALGQLDDTLVGHDVAGVITQLGPGTESSGLRIGDRVCGIAQGRFASSSQAYWTGIAKLPEELSWEDGAAIPVAYVTAYHSLVRLGGLQKGDTVLIHAAAGGVGQAAIVLARHIGAEVFATCSTGAKRDLLTENFDIDPTRIFSSRDESFASAIMSATGGRGVDVVVNSLSGSLLKATWSCIARFGRFIEIGKVDIEATRSLNMAPFGRCATYVGFDALQLNEYNGPLTHEALTESVRICHARATGSRNRRPMYPIQQYSISDLEKAMRQMQNGLHVGKLVLMPLDGDQVNVISRPPSLSLAKDTATYLIAGGAGGIGRAIASWMIQHGAKNILLVSRNAESHPGAVELAQTASAQGCNVHVRNCDIANEDSFIELLEYCSSVSLPPIRGVINGAMVLDDAIFERMTFAQWQLAIKTKVQSSMNLHKHLPDLSFFVLLSSVTGVAGHVSQANYAAGNTFQDALARNRASSGLCAVSLNLSAVIDAGFVANMQHSSQAEGNRVQSRVEALGTISLDMVAIQRILESAVLRHPWRSDPNDAQLILGLAPWDRLPEGAVVQKDRRFGTLRLTSFRNAAAGMSAAAAEAAGSTSPTGMLLRALQASPAIKKTHAVAQAVVERLSIIFNVSAEQLDLSVPLALHGVDSMVAVELRNWLAGSAKAKLSMFEVLQSRSLLDFASLIVQRSQIVIEK